MFNVIFSKYVLTSSFGTLFGVHLCVNDYFLFIDNLVDVDVCLVVFSPKTREADQQTDRERKSFSLSPLGAQAA